MTFDSFYTREFKDYQQYKGELLRVDTKMNKSMCYRNGQINYGCVEQFIKKSLTLSCQPLNKYISYVVIRGVTEQYFDRLNSCKVILQPRIEYSKRTFLHDGTFLTDASGEVIRQNVDIPQQSRVVATRTNIQLKRISDGRKHEPSEGFGYLDVDTINGNQMYLYYVPRENIYPLNLNALLITPTKLRSKFYSGKEYALAFGLPVLYMYVVPFTPKLFIQGNVILSPRSNTSFGELIRTIETHWFELGLLYPRALTMLSSHETGLTSCLSEKLLNSRGVTDYVQTTSSLAELNRQNSEE